MHIQLQSETLKERDYLCGKQRCSWEDKIKLALKETGVSVEMPSSDSG
jgi:hypothetical protein